MIVFIFSSRHRAFVENNLEVDRNLGTRREVASGDSM
jgi:hypothetical protein